MASRYFGTVQGGKRHGVGMLVVGDCGYCGEFKADMKHGHGRLREPDRSYEGQWDSDRRHGIGKEEAQNKTITGMWENDAVHGTAMVVSDKVSHLAVFRSNLKNGPCIIRQDDKEIGRGYYEKDEKTGWWKELDQGSGGVFSGEYRNGARNGFGSLTSNEVRYRGFWQDNKMEGFGIYQKEGIKYEGDFKAGKFDGIGRLTEKSKKGTSKYTGQFEANLKAGFGKLEDFRGSYVGGFDNNQKAGLGYIRLGPETTYLGYWASNLREGLGILIEGRKITKADWSLDTIHGYCHTTLPGKKPLFEIFEEGKYIHDADTSKMKEFLELVDEKIPNKFVEFALAKTTKIEAEITKQLKRLENFEEPNLDFKLLLTEYESIKTRLSNGVLKGQRERDSLLNYLEKKGVDLRGGGYQWDIEKMGQAKSPSVDKNWNTKVDDKNASPKRKDIMDIPVSPQAFESTKKARIKNDSVEKHMRKSASSLAEKDHAQKYSGTKKADTDRSKEEGYKPWTQDGPCPHCRRSKPEEKQVEEKKSQPPVINQAPIQPLTEEELRDKFFDDKALRNRLLEDPSFLHRVEENRIRKVTRSLVQTQPTANVVVGAPAKKTNEPESSSKREAPPAVVEPPKPILSVGTFKGLFIEVKKPTGVAKHSEEHNPEPPASTEQKQECSSNKVDEDTSTKKPELDLASLFAGGDAQPSDANDSKDDGQRKPGKLQRKEDDKGQSLHMNSTKTFKLPRPISFEPYPMLKKIKDMENSLFKQCMKY